MVYEQIWYAITLLGSPRGWIAGAAVLLIIYLIIKGELRPSHKQAFRRFLLILIPTLTVTLALTQGLKITVPAERVCIPCLEGQTQGCNPYCLEDNSFPSGHTATAFAVFTSLFLANPKRKHALVFIIPLLVALSRLALGVHTLTDVFIGVVLAVFISLGVAKALQNKKLI